MPSLFPGALIFRNINAAFEKEIERQACVRSISATVDLEFMQEEGSWTVRASVLSEDGRSLTETFDAGEQKAEPCRKKGILLRKTGKVTKTLPQKDTTYQNNISNHLSKQIYREAGASGDIAEAYELSHTPSAELMRTKYCIRYELGLCPVHQGNRNVKPLFLINNGQRFALHFDCKACEMTLTEA